MNRDEKLQDGERNSTISDADIVSVRTARRTFLRMAGASLLGATAAAAGAASLAHDFPKGNSDTNETVNADLKAVDSDQRNSKAVDNDRSRLRDVRRSSDSD
jgi:hypothetical protein